MAVNPLNVFAGKVTVKVDLTPDYTTPGNNTYTDLGFTLDGLTLDLESNVPGINVDQVEFPVMGILAKMGCTFTVNLAEHTLNVLKMAVPGVVTATSANVYDVGSVGNPSGDSKVEFAMQMTGPGPNSLTNTLTIPRATIVSASDIAFKRDGLAFWKTVVGAMYAGSNNPLFTLNQA